MRTLFSTSPAVIRAPRASRLLKRLLARKPTDVPGETCDPGKEMVNGSALERAAGAANFAVPEPR